MTDPTFDPPTPRLWRTLTTPNVFDPRPDPWDEFARRSIPTPPHVYRRRRLVLVVVVAFVAVIGLGIREGAITDEAPPANSPDLLDEPNGTSDGRYHTCGYVTEDGVTEHLDAYQARCGDPTFTSDTKHPRREVTRMATTIINPRRKTATKALARKAFTDEVARRAKPRKERGKASSWVFSMLDNADLAAVLDGSIVSATSNSGKIHHIGVRA